MHHSLVLTPFIYKSHFSLLYYLNLFLVGYKSNPICYPYYVLNFRIALHKSN